MIAGQHEAGDAFDVVDADGDRFHAFAEHRGQRRALARAGDLAGKDRFVDVDRHQHDAFARGEIGDLAERAGRQRILRPRHFAQRRRVEFVAEPQRTIGDHDRALRRRHFALGLEVPHARIGLVVEPGLRQEDRRAIRTGLQSRS